MNSNYNVQLFLVTPCLSPKIFKNVSHLTRETGPNFQLSGKQSAFTKDVHSFFFWSSQLTFSKCRPQLFTPDVWKNEVSKKLFQFHKVLNLCPKIALVTCVSCFLVINMKKVQAVVSVKFFKNVNGHKLGYQDLMCNAFEGHHQVISLLLDFYHAIMSLSL